MPPSTHYGKQKGPVFEKPAGPIAGKPQFPNESAHGDNSPRPEQPYPPLTSAPDQGTQWPYMHALARGDLLQRLRLATGLILFTFVATHFLNHSLGLVSLEAMHAMQDWRKAVTRTWPGSIVLLGAFVTHKIGRAHV